MATYGSSRSDHYSLRRRRDWRITGGPALKKRHDVMSRAKRSALMASIKSTNTGIEKLMEGALSQLSVEFVAHPKLYGNPDFILRKERTAIFCDGDFWHGYRLGRNRRLDVKDNRHFWIAKIKSNIHRDKEVNRALSAMGWNIVRLWEHDIKKDPLACARRTIGASLPR